MRIVSERTIREFWQANPDAERPLRAWRDNARRADWKTPIEVKADYGSASIVSNNRVVFNIKGNDYRLVTAIHYNTGIIYTCPEKFRTTSSRPTMGQNFSGGLYVRFVGTHEEYDQIDVTEI